MAAEDPYNLARFVTAQTPIYSEVLNELRAGHKRSHWIWFIFPQIAGLGYSHRSRVYAISSADEACAYLTQPILGPRLLECTEMVNQVPDRSIHEILGEPDDLKFHSCITLFHTVAPSQPIFQQALNKYFSGQSDPATLARL
jgi:uncharacterized protein (DUF1810 family)